MTRQIDEQTISGVAWNVTFHNPENGYCVLKLKVEGHRQVVPLVGVVGPSISQGELIEAQGKWITDPKFGRQFKAAQIRILPPTSLKGIERYLASGQIRNIGPKMAKALVGHFKEKVFEVIEHDDARLLELDGIGEKRRAAIVDAWEDQRQMRDLSVFLQGFGLGPARAMRVYRSLGEDAISMIRQNPYTLISHVKGLGFKIVDEMALKMGIAEDSLQRAQAGLVYALEEASSEGHTAMPKQTLLDEAAERLELPIQRLEAALDQALKTNQLILRADDEHAEVVFTPKLYFSEQSVARDVTRLLTSARAWDAFNIDEALEVVQHGAGIEYAEGQIKVIREALTSSVCVITGGPGVGKTTIMQGLLRICLQQAKRVLLAAPTGRAAKRLSEATDHAAKTIHRLLEYDPVSNGFKHHRQCPLKCDVLILDESSMLDINLMQKLIQAIPDGARLWLVGDIDQLPSVGPGAVLADMIASDAVTVLRLTEVYRQAKHSHIVRNAHKIHEGEIPYLGPPNTDRKQDFYFIASHSPEDAHAKLIEVVTRRIPAKFGFDPIKDIQVLTPMNRSGLGSKALNPELQAQLNPQTVGIERFGQRFSVGDKVLQLSNNYDQDVYNGDLGLVIDVDPKEAKLWVNFDGRRVEYTTRNMDELTLAYAMSIHKSQGGEFPVVVIPIVMQHFMMLERNLLYTAVTRGRKLVVIIGDKRAMSIAVRTQKAGARLTRLAQAIRRQGEGDTASTGRQVLSLQAIES